MRLVALVGVVFLISCGRTETTEDAPVALVRALDAKAVVGQVFRFSGSESNDPLDEPLTLRWRLASSPRGSRPQLSELTVGGRVAVEVALVPDLPGLYVLELVAFAGSRTSQPANGFVLVGENTNRPPIADAGRSRTVGSGSLVTLDGSGSSDPDGDALRFEWSTISVPNGALSPPAREEVRLQFVPFLVGLYRFSLRVTDSLGAVATAQVVIEVVAPNPLPDAGAPDAGPRDAGTPDAGPRDAGTPDAGSRDAGPPDAGARDAGLPPVDGGGAPVLNPADIYIAGTLSEGACYLNALAHISTPNVASVGFDCYFDESEAKIRPTDGRLLYTNTFENLLREYRCDECTYRGVYPANVLANDPIVPTPCPGSTDRLTQFKVSADGEVFHRCSGSLAVWRDSQGVGINTGTGFVVSFGGNGWVLTDTRIINNRTNTSLAITGLRPFFAAVLAVRWRAPDAWMLALSNDPAPTELWMVNVTGTAQLVGTYPAPPAQVTPRFASELDATGRLFQIGSDTSASFTDVILRREIGGTSTVVYTEASNPLVKLHISDLVTGP